MRRLCLYVVCAWLSALPTARADIIVNWLDEPIILSHGEFAGVQTPLDINGDGVTDFTFLASVSLVGVRSENQNRYIIFPSPPPNIGGGVEPLYSDFQIGPDLNDSNLEWFGIPTDFAPFGIWMSGESGGRFIGHHAFMGVEFEIDDSVHYGWINIKVEEDFPYGRIYGWAYESSPDTPIIAGEIPEPNTLLLLIGGAALLLGMRSKKYIR